MWRAAADAQPAGTVVLRTTGLQGGQAGLANLADLVEPVTGAVLHRLPQPQAEALRAALGLASAQAPVTSMLLERATVGVLRELAAAVWWSQSMTSSGWTGQPPAARERRRPAEGRAGALAGGGPDRARRPRARPAARSRARTCVTRVELAGLDDAALSELVMRRFPGWSPGVLRQLVALAAGSPYAALELARETAARGGRDSAAVHLPSTLAGSLRRRLDRLSPPVLTVVQAAAVAEAPTRALLRAFTDGPVGECVDEALEAGLLEATAPDPVLRFSHPLLREAAGAMLSGPRRRRLHRVIGAALNDPDEAAWHLACGADEPDETLAERAEQAASRASARGAPARAAAWLRRRPGSPRTRRVCLRGAVACCGWSS